MSSSLERRLSALEDRADEIDRKAATDTRLADGVERLSGETVGLTTILERVNEQQAQLSNLNSAVETKASKGDVVDVAREARNERRKSLHQIYILVSAALAIALAGVVGGAWLTDKHIQECILHGPSTEAEIRFCDVTFPGHEHPPELSLDGLLAAGDQEQQQAILNSRKGCERTQARVRIEVEKERTLAITDIEATRPAHIKAAEALEATLIDCNAEYPLPAVAERLGD